MHPKPIRVLEGSEADRFKEIDRRAIRKSEIEATKRSVRIFLEAKPKR